MIKNVLFYLRGMRNVIDRAKGLVTSKQDFIKPGKYKLVIAGKAILYNRSNSIGPFLIKQSKEAYAGFPILRLYLKRALANLFTITIPPGEAEELTYQGEIILLTIKDNIKIFDLERNVVLNFITDIGKYQHLKDTYKIFRLFFNIPIKNFYDKNALIIENYIDFCPTDANNLQAQNEILELYCRDFNEYLKHCIGAGKFTTISSIGLWNSFSDKFKNLGFMERIHDYLKSKDGESWLQVLCHGDINLHNILSDGEKYYLIDWEHSSQYLFFYDFFNFIIYPALKQNDSSLMVDYLKGRYDYIISKFFKTVGLKYNKKERQFYLVISIMQGITKRNYGLGTNSCSRRLALADTVLENYTQS